MQLMACVTRIKQQILLFHTVAQPSRKGWSDCTSDNKEENVC